MKVFTQTYDLAKTSPHRFWVTPYSDFKIGIKILAKGEVVDKDFTVKAGAVELTPDEDKIDGFTLYTIKSGDTGFVEYTIEVEDIAEKLKLTQIVTDSTVFEVGGEGGDVPADVATQTWVNSQISDFVDEDALTAYYTKSETSSATELADAFASAGGGAISAFDMSENPVMSKTLVSEAARNGICLPQTLYLDSNGNVSEVLNLSGTYSSNSPRPSGGVVGGLIVGTQITAFNGFPLYVAPSKSGGGLVLPNTLKTIGDNAFNTIPTGSAEDSPVINIPDSVTSISNPRYKISGNRRWAYMDFGNTRRTIPQATSTDNVNPDCIYYVPDALYDTWITTSPWSNIADQIHRHSELEAPYATSKAEDAWWTAQGLAGEMGAKVNHLPARLAPEVLNIMSYYESEYAQLSVDDPTWEPDENTMYVILPDQV